MNEPVLLITDFRVPGARAELENLIDAHTGRTHLEFLTVRVVATTFIPGRFDGDPKAKNTMDPSGLLEPFGKAKECR